MICVTNARIMPECFAENSQVAFTFRKSTMKTPEQCINSVRRKQYRHQNVEVVLVSSLLILNRFHTFSGVSVFDFEQVNADCFNIKGTRHTSIAGLKHIYHNI